MDDRKKNMIVGMLLRDQNPLLWESIWSAYSDEPDEEPTEDDKRFDVV